MFPYYISYIYFNLLFLFCCGAFQKDKMLIKIPQAHFFEGSGQQKVSVQGAFIWGPTDIWQQIVSVRVNLI